MKIGIASDHAGFELKKYLIECAKMNPAIKWVDFGTTSKESCDYPDFVHPLCEALCNNEFSFGIIICGSANGVAITANKHYCVRAAICWNSEVTILARQHNDANICALPARFLTKEQALEIVEIFMNEKFEGGRHEIRIRKIPISKLK